MSRFVHEALLYQSDDEFLQGAAPFVRLGREAGEPVLVATDSAKIEKLRSALGPGSADVAFADMAELGKNPGRIISAWKDFVGSAAGPCRGIGEPLWAGRSEGERLECHRHEQLLNLAFADAAGFTLVCPYDVGRLPAEDINLSHRTHPAVAANGDRYSSGLYGSLGDPSIFDEPLPEIPGEPYVSTVRKPEELSPLRSSLAEHATAAGVPELSARSLVLAVNECVANSLRHGGGVARIRIWELPGTLVCEVQDRGHVADPLAGRFRPAPDQTGGRGLWLVHQLADLVELRTSPAGTTVRVTVGASLAA